MLVKLIPGINFANNFLSIFSASMFMLLFILSGRVFGSIRKKWVRISADILEMEMVSKPCYVDCLHYSLRPTLNARYLCT